ncbi:MAG: M23 family metallopeptidase [Pseudomonadota bacterium]|nr:M23 family metallopeptidase [Pseudomonadota bacterium]
MKKLTLLSLGVPLFLFICGFLLPQPLRIPVQGASNHDWNHQTFWYYPWGASKVHKGIDIFAHESTPVIAATYGIILTTGSGSRGGNTILMLGPKWRLHYYAHLKKIDVHRGALVVSGQPLGEVGTTGNAQGKPPHLHYSILTLFPYIWRWDNSHLGHLKMFFLNPSALLLAESASK